MRLALAGTLVAAAVLAASPLAAASLQVQPALVDVTAPTAAATLTLRNEGPAPINIQVRVFRWSQTQGEEKLEPTEDVVASPPAVTLEPKTDYVARVVRVAKGAVAEEESYRLFVDELPGSVQQKTNTINIVVRHSIPVFFGPQGKAPPAVSWSVARAGGKLVVKARNAGAARLRVSALVLRDQGGKTVSFGPGLVGYVLGRSTMRWAAPGAARGFAAAGAVSISAQGNDGPVHAVAQVDGGR